MVGFFAWSDCNQKALNFSAFTVRQDRFSKSISHILHALGTQRALCLGKPTLIVAAFALSLPQTARAQDCQQAFASLRWTLVAEDSSWQLSSERAGQILLGTACETEFVKSWFATAGWALIAEGTNSPENSGPFGPSDREYRQDSWLAFCLPRKWPWRWLTQGCSMGVSISLFEDHITSLIAGAYQ